VNIRKKTIYIAGSMVVVLIIILYSITRFVMLDRFEQLQVKETEKNMLRISEVLKSKEEALYSISYDWAMWDDNYAFMNGEYPDFIEVNLTDDVFNNLGLNVTLFIDSGGNIVYKKFYDLINLSETALPEDLLKNFQPGSGFLQHENNEDSKSGIINLDSGPLLVVSQPVLKSDKSGPIAGSMVWGFYLDETVVKSISSTVKNDVELIKIKPQSASEAALGDNTVALLSKFKDGANLYLENISNKNISGNLLVNDFYGKPSLILRSVMPRDIYNQGQESLNYLILLISGAILIVTAAFIIVIGKIIKNHEAKMNYAAEHDELTGIPNRRFFEDFILKAISKAKRGKKSFLIFFDVDNFKFINDTYGHHFGDKVLIGISGHLQKTLRKEDLLARFGGDEFTILLEHDDMKKAKSMAERLRKHINEFDITIGSDNFHFSVSMGLVEIEPDESVNEILARADRAMYSAKQNGKDQLVVLEREFSFNTTNGLVIRLKNALKGNLFKVYYQPVIKLSSNKVAYYEALSRLEDYLEPAVTPDVFIPVMERFGLINELTRFVFSEITTHLKDDPEKCIFMNLSAKSFNDKSMLAFIRDTIVRSKANPNQFGFEITETAMLNDIFLTKEWINRIKKMGCRFAIDDFGSGFTSFNILRELPVDFYKIDGKIIKGMNKDYSGAAMVKSVKLLANLLGKETVAEWIENGETEASVKSMGVEYGQGYYYAKPEPDMKSDDKVNKRLTANRDRFKASSKLKVSI
jgi:diguanylate cyclase (GGDEF)-like protein